MSECRGYPDIAIVPPTGSCVVDSQQYAINKLPTEYPAMMSMEDLQTAYAFVVADFDSADSPDWNVYKYVLGSSSLSSDNEEQADSTCGAQPEGSGSSGVYYSYYKTIKTLELLNGVSREWIVETLNCDIPCHGITKGPAALIQGDLTIPIGPTVTPAPPRVSVERPWYDVLRASSNVLRCVGPTTACPGNRWRLVYSGTGGVSHISWLCDCSSEESEESESYEPEVPSWCDSLQINTELLDILNRPIKSLYLSEDLDNGLKVKLNIIYSWFNGEENFPGGENIIATCAASDYGFPGVSVRFMNSSYTTDLGDTVTVGMSALGPNTARTETLYALVRKSGNNPCPTDASVNSVANTIVTFEAHVPVCGDMGDYSRFAIGCTALSELCQKLQVSCAFARDQQEVSKVNILSAGDMSVKVTFTWLGDYDMPNNGFFLDLFVALDKATGVASKVSFEDGASVAHVQIPLLTTVTNTGVVYVPLIIEGTPCTTGPGIPCEERIEKEDTQIKLEYSFAGDMEDQDACTNLSGSANMTVTCGPEEGDTSESGEAGGYTASVTFRDYDSWEEISWLDNSSCERGRAYTIIMDVEFTAPSAFYFCDDERKATLALTGNNCFASFLNEDSGLKNINFDVPDIDMELGPNQYAATIRKSFAIRVTLQPGEVSGSLSAALTLPKGGTGGPFDLAIQAGSCIDPPDKMYSVKLFWFDPFEEKAIEDLCNNCNAGINTRMYLVLVFDSPEEWTNGGADTVTVALDSQGGLAWTPDDNREGWDEIEVPQINQPTAEGFTAEVVLPGWVKQTNDKKCASITASAKGSSARLTTNRTGACAGCGCADEESSESSEGSDSGGDCQYVMSGDDYIICEWDSISHRCKISLNTAMFTRCNSSNTPNDGEEPIIDELEGEENL